MWAYRMPAVAKGRVDKVTRESGTKKAMEKYERKMRLISRYADDPPHLNLILSHGEYQKNALATKFQVREDQIIVFVSKTGVYLPQTIIDEAFYDIFENAQNVSDLLKRRMGHAVPWYLKGLEKRTYAPGDQCPNLTLHMFDPAWGGMGLHALPLTTRLEGPDAPPGQFRGQTMKLSDLTGRGVLFVVACRAVVGQRQIPTYMHAPEHTLRARASSPEAQLQRFDKRVNIRSTREFQRGVRQLREAIRMGDERVPMNVDGMPPHRRAAMASVIRQRASALRKKRVAEKKKEALRKKRVAEKKAARR